ncbi:MFS transporter [Patescibacteria group bacterium AH-259-L07]|nr:MFS transporter [Patescibacteria group bacterium AH-259-L07]
MHLFKRLQFSPDFKLLCVYHTIVSLASGMIGIFLPIFLFQEFGYSVYLVIVFYMAGYALYALLVPFGAMVMSKIGLKRSMMTGRAFIILFYLSLYFLHSNPLIFAILANINLLIFRLVYWIPYHTSFVEFTDGRHRGRQMAWLAILRYLVGIGAPLLAGLLLTSYSFNLLFILVMVILAFALIPLSGLSDVKARFEYSYFQTFRELLKKKNRRWRMAYAADGGQSMVGVMIWPIFIYQILEGQYLAVGAVTALVVIGSITLQLFIGEYTDKVPKKRLIKLGSFIYALGWTAKAFVATAFQIFVVGTFHSLASIMLRTPFDAYYYDLSTDRGAYIDEYTVLREISLHTGRALMGILLLILISLVSFQIAFVLAAAVSLLLNLL